MELFIKFTDVMNKGIVKVVGVCMMVMTVLVAVQVFARYIIGFSYPWTEELARYFMIIAAFLGVGVAVRRGQLIAMEAVIQFVPEKVGFVLKNIALLITIIFYIILFVLGIDMVELSGEETAPVTKIPMFLVYGVLPISAVIMLTNSIVVFYNETILKIKED